jgi:hypothetical protein
MFYSILPALCSGAVRRDEGRLQVAGEEFRVLDSLGQGGYSKVSRKFRLLDSLGQGATKDEWREFEVLNFLGQGGYSIGE